MTDVLILAVVVVVTAATALWWRAAQGRVTAVDPTTPAARLSDADRDALGAPPGRVLLLEFTAPGCTPCAATGRILTDVAGDRSDVTVVLADVAEHVDLARAHRVLRAPTTLVVDPGGAIRHRISGVPAAPAVEALVAEASAGVRQVA